MAPGVRGAALAAGLVLGLAGAAHAAPFSAPAGRLGQVAAALGLQARATIAVADPALAAVHSPGVKASPTLRSALAEALKGTGGEAVFLDPTTVRIVRASPPPPPRPPAQTPAPSPRPLETPEIVVTASKQRIPLAAYPGTVDVVVLDPAWVGRNAADGTAAIVRLLPALGSTDLGPGRDKLFIRGVADSSFNGPTQATTGEYLGDVRLNFNAPDPNLNLYDMQRIEVLAGPQGTLYGAGSIGGVVRLVPNAPDARAAAASVSAGVSATQDGGPGGDLAAMVNLPVIDDRVAVRLVAFAARQAGYIDDPSLGQRDINSTTSTGGRMTWRLQNLSGWTIDVGLALQDIATRDGQYTLSEDPPLTRYGLVAQPFHSDYALGYLAARKRFGDAELVSTTSIARQDLTSVFDATGYGGSNAPQRFQENNDTLLYSHETRISGDDPRAPWVAGVSLISNFSTLSRSLGPLGAPAQIAGVTNVQAEGAVFGQVSEALTPTLTATVGERVTFTDSTGIVTDVPASERQAVSRDVVRFAATLALDWRPPGPFSAFFHYQQGYRPGGLAVAPSGSGVASQRFMGDQLNMDEIGIRLGDPARSRLSLRAAVFATDWNHIQADLVDASGLPYTTNIGHGAIVGLDGSLTWRPTRALTLGAAAFINGSDLYAPAPGFAVKGLQSLPNIANSGGRLSMAWTRTFASGVTLESHAAVRYVGHSELGVGPVLDIPQGGYMVADAGARLAFSRFALSLDIANLGDTRANTFAFGDPFGVAQRDQVTPLRPRTVRLGIDARY